LHNGLTLPKPTDLLQPLHALLAVKFAREKPSPQCGA
jgi:hypothetical protein